MTRINTKLAKLECLKPIFICFLSLGIATCSQKEATAETNSNKINAEAPAIGTDIKDMVKKPSSANTTGEIKEIMWEDLIPNDFKPDSIVQKYKKQVESISEGSGEENSAKAQALMDKIMAELNNAPANKELDGVKVKIPGFVALLDEKDGMVSEFLLVPYYGSCIHSPPPPTNQTVLVITQTGKSISVDDSYKPVWVTGRVKVEKQETELAKAAYVIQDAKLEIYERKEVNLNPVE